MSLPDYGRAFALWRTAAGADWDRYVGHDFVCQLAAGTLPRASFLHYLQQDYVFLLHFARAWALVFAKSDRLSEMRAASLIAHGLLHDEMPLHVSLCAREGISEEMLQATPESPANMAYTRYVHATGYAGDLLDLLAALAPCVLGYGEIGRRHAASVGPYGDWTATYGGADYQRLCVEVGALTDAALEARLGPDWPRLPRAVALARHFSQATQLEAGFWQMGLDRA
ncbi:TenA family protein [Paracoccus nototheniae]|uniref:TenA family protein n=1 Tax=Paracoccus nototheniae TaxID=2489002 RepID=A0ABW4E0L2_9RHOB|nr:TenA family protein [Paracoccus nototheniae]